MEKKDKKEFPLCVNEQVIGPFEAAAQKTTGEKYKNASLRTDRKVRTDRKTEQKVDKGVIPLEN